MSGSAQNASPEDGREGSIVRVINIVNTRGLHARASAKFVQTVERYEAQVTVTRGGSILIRGHPSPRRRRANTWLQLG